MTEPRADACPGPCNTAYRRAWAAYADARNRWCDRLAVELAWWRADTALGYDLPAPEPPEPERPTLPPHVGEPTWCDRCTALVVRALAELDDLAALLEANSDGHHRPQASEGKVSGGGGTGSPAPVAELLDELYGTLTTVEDQWRRHRGYTTRPPRSHRGAHARTVCVSWLAGEAHAILSTRSQGARTFGLTVLGWHRRLQAAGHAKPAPRRLPVRCPRCQWRALRRRDNGYVGCEKCGRLMTEDEYQDELTGQGAMAG